MRFAYCALHTLDADLTLAFKAICRLYPEYLSSPRPDGWEIRELFGKQWIGTGLKAPQTAADR